MSSQLADKPRLAGLDELRGLAALLVLIMHLIQTVNLGSGTGVIGLGGVSGFFILTGFLMPYLLVEKYANFKNSTILFLSKRLLRLSPPFLIAAVIVASYQVVRGHISAAEQLSAEMIGCHLTYSCGLLQLRWYGEIFWTLAIEFQYYLFAAFVMLVIGFISRPHRIVVLAIIATSMVLLQFALQSSSIDSAIVKDWMPKYSIRFAIGLVCYGLYLGIKPAMLWPLLALLIYFDWHHVIHGFTIAFFSICLVFQSSNRFAPFKWLGKVSYSLYLTHALFGVVAAKSLLLVFSFEGADVLAIFFGAAVSFAVAHIFWYFIERPAQRWSDAVKGEKLT